MNRFWLVAMTVPALASAEPQAAPISQAEYAARRAALTAIADSGVFVAFGAREPVDHYPPFAQRAPFRYLTGFLAPDAALIIVKRGGHITTTLFVQSSNPRREFYTGARMAPAAVRAETGMDAEINERFVPVLDSLAATGLGFWIVGDAESDEFIAPDSLSFGSATTRRLGAAHPFLAMHDATRTLDSLRARKSAAEVALLRRAAAISTLGHLAAPSAIGPGRNEGDVQAIMEYTFRRNGGERPAYSSIVGSGPNSTTLHYDRDDRVMQGGEVILMDCATSYQGYAADVTRTLPVSGTFTADQRGIYQIVRDAQAAGERQVRPGVPGSTEVDSIRAVVSAGLTRLGLVDSTNAMIDAPPGFCGRTTECRQVTLFMPHGPGHGLGLDVHDPAQWYYANRAFGVGDVFTIEPGIYIRPGITDILPDTPRNRAYVARVRPLLERYANIGVRIEDDYVVTDTGVERLSLAPREVREVEDLMKHRRPALADASAR
ncbi:MAG TPA: Xaa-Pro aminopeptidase [Gemmatimonadaceae bacterium]|nr:Xaa-Pro aminopeptidase [Gemmatimonadaceae bacterium]